MKTKVEVVTVEIENPWEGLCHMMAIAAAAEDDGSPQISYEIAGMMREVLKEKRKMLKKDLKKSTAQSSDRESIVKAAIEKALKEALPK